MLSKSLIVIASALFLTGCATTTTNLAKYSNNNPQRGTVAQASDTASKGARPNAPVLLRIIKETKTLELWKQDRDNTWIKAKTYAICAYSGRCR